MKRLLLAGLSTLVMATALTPAAKAEITAASPSFPTTAESIGMGVTPFNLVFLAYQGFFEDEGIPMASGLISSYRAGRVSAEDLVRVAVDMNRLSSGAINDSSYVTAVDRQLNDLVNSNSGS